MNTILFLNHNQENHGTYYRCMFLGNELSTQGYKIKMICASGGKFDLFIRKKHLNENFTIYTLPRIKYHQYFTGQIFRLFLTLFFVLFCKYDVCYGFTMAQPQIAIPAFVAKKIRKKKLIIDWDDMWGGGFAEEHIFIVTFVLRWCERFFLQFADIITYVSELILDEIEIVSKRYPRLDSIAKFKIPNGANVEKIPKLDKSICRKKLGIGNEIILLSVGNTYTDSLKRLFEAFEIVGKSNLKVFLYMVGNVVIPDRFKTLYEGNKKNIILTGKIPFEKIPYFMGAADVLLLPMEDNIIERARFPMRFGDYLCAGRPIVSNAVGEVKYYLNKYKVGLVAEHNDPEDYAQKINEVIENKALGHEVSINARHLAENELNWKNVCNQLGKNIKFSVLKKGKR